MTAPGWWLTFICAVSAAVSSFLLRVSIDRSGGFEFQFHSLFHLMINPIFVLGIFLYGIAGIGWFRVLATEPLSVAYPALISATFVLVTLGATFIFKEPVSILKIVGLAVIILGIFFVARG